MFIGIVSRRKIMSFDSVLKTLGLRERSLVERVNAKVMKGYEPSEMAKRVVGRVSARRFNIMMVDASVKYNENHEVKVFKDE